MDKRTSDDPAWIPQDVVASVGYVVIAASMLEFCLGQMAITFDPDYVAPRRTWLPGQASDHRKLVRQAAGRLESDALQTSMLKWEGRAAAALDRRDRLVHGTWMLDPQRDFAPIIRHLRSDTSQIPEVETFRGLALELNTLANEGIALSREAAAGQKAPPGK